MKISPENYHNLLAYAELYIGEGATTAVEAAILGIPSIYVSSINLGYIDELHTKYHAIEKCKDHVEALNMAITKLNNPNIKKEQEFVKQKIIEEKGDLTKWFLDLIENIDINGLFD